MPARWRSAGRGTSPTDGPGRDHDPGLGLRRGSHPVAAAIVLILTAVICTGMKLSAQVNIVFVAIKVAIVLLVIVAGLFFIKSGNYSPVHPALRLVGTSGGSGHPLPAAGPRLRPRLFGMSGIFTGAALVFFAFIGFDIVATAAEETKNPQRDMPIGILARSRSAPSSTSPSRWSSPAW